MTIGGSNLCFVNKNNYLCTSDTHDAMLYLQVALYGIYNDKVITPYYYWTTVNDKQIGYFDLPKEDNPAMGMRALRICLTRPEIFKTQLRALFRASAFGKLGIMFPMVTSVWEVREAKKLCEEVKRELKQEGIPYSEEVQIGIMIGPEAVDCCER